MICPACLFSFDSIKYFLSHLKYFSTLEDNLHFNTKYLCLKCSYESTGIKDFYFHLKQHFDYNSVEINDNLNGFKILKKYTCKYCKKSFNKSSDLTRHIRIHTNEKPFFCLKCKRRFKLKSTLESHLKTHQLQRFCEQFTCLFCKKNFLSFSALKLHIRIHTNETPFPCDSPQCQQSFRTKKLMLTHFRNFHQSFKNSNNLFYTSKYLPNFSVPNATRAVIQSIKEISHLKGQPLITSQNSAFSKFHKNRVDDEQILKNSDATAQVVVIRVQVRSGSVVAGSSVGQAPTDIILEPSSLMNLSQNGHFMYIALKKTGLPLSVALSVDPSSVLNRLDFFSKSILNSTSHCFTSVVYPTAQHVISNPPLPFSILCTKKEDLYKIRGHMPSFLIECFMAASHSNQYDVEQRQVFAQSCLPMLCNEDGIQCEINDKNKQQFEYMNV